MRNASSKSTPHATSAAPPAKHSPSGSPRNAAGRAATSAGGQSGASDGGSWTTEMENGSTPGTDAAQGVAIDTSPGKPTDAGPNHGNHKGG